MYLLLFLLIAVVLLSMYILKQNKTKPILQDISDKPLEVITSNLPDIPDKLLTSNLPDIPDKLLTSNLPDILDKPLEVIASNLLEIKQQTALQSENLILTPKEVTFTEIPIKAPDTYNLK